MGLSLKLFEIISLISDFNKLSRILMYVLLKSLLVFSAVSAASAESWFVGEKNICFENKHARGEYLYPSSIEHKKYNDQYEPKFKGRALTGSKNDDSPNWNHWSIIEVSSKDNIYKIYNNEVKGYLNARFKLRDQDRRDVFVETEGDRNNWKFHKHSENEYSIQNVMTSEYIYAILGRDDKKLLYSDDPGRTTFTWDYKEETVDASAIWIIRENCGEPDELDELKNLWNKTDLCFENKNSRNEYLYPSPNYHRKYSDPQESKFSGRALTGFAPSKSPNWNQWSIFPVSNGVYKIYNNGFNGFLNARLKLQDNDRRDVFVEKDCEGDNWKLHKKYDNQYALENVRTGEYLYAILGRNDKELMYQGESGRTTYTWNYRNDPIDSSAIWIISSDCTRKVFYI